MFALAGIVLAAAAIAWLTPGSTGKHAVAATLRHALDARSSYPRSARWPTSTAGT
jgi:hypothetical protein